MFIQACLKKNDKTASFEGATLKNLKIILKQ